jgi:hypothetical protein
LNNWHCIYKSTNSFDAELLKSLLESEGIECVVMNNKDSAYPLLGEIQLFVPSEKTIEANSILQLHYKSVTGERKE